MRTMKLIYQKDAQPPSSSRAPVIWPWILVIAAWTVALLAALTKQTFLINHNYLLTQSHLSWLIALVLFLACWQVMTIAMMLPSSMPLVYMMVHASRRQRYPWATQAAFWRDMQLSGPPSRLRRSWQTRWCIDWSAIGSGSTYIPG